MGKLGFKEINVDNWLEPDEIMKIFAQLDSNGEIAEISKEKWLQDYCCFDLAYSVMRGSCVLRASELLVSSRDVVCLAVVDNSDKCTRTFLKLWESLGTLLGRDETRDVIVGGRLCQNRCILHQSCERPL